MICSHNPDLENTDLAAKGFTLVVIDPSITDYTTLATAVVSEAVAVILDSNRDGVEQISEILQQYPHTTSLHIVSHGAPGCVYLGNSQLSLATIHRYANQLRNWPVSSLLLYGCNAAAGDAGEEFLAKLHRTTGANIAASSTRIGSAAQGANWELDVQVGEACGPLAFTSQLLQTYTGVFL